MTLLTKTRVLLFVLHYISSLWKTRRKKEAEQHGKMRLKKKEELRTLRAFWQYASENNRPYLDKFIAIDAFHQRVLSTAQRTNVWKCPS